MSGARTHSGRFSGIPACAATAASTAHVAGTERVPRRTRLGIYGHAYRSRLVGCAAARTIRHWRSCWRERDFARARRRVHRTPRFAHSSRFATTEMRLRSFSLPAALPTGAAARRSRALGMDDGGGVRRRGCGPRRIASPVEHGAGGLGDDAASRFILHVRVLALAWNAPQVWKAVTDDTDASRAAVSARADDVAAVAAGPQGVVTARWARLRHRCARRRARAGETLRRSLRGICALHCREDEAPAQAAGFLRQWIESGLIVDGSSLSAALAASTWRTIDGPSPRGAAMRPQVFSNALEMIGRTPLLAARRLDTGPCQLFLKLENQNPGGSIKDRVGLYLIEAAEREGRIKPGGTLIEATAGNTGLGPRAGRRAEGLPPAARHPRQDEPGEDLSPEGDGRGSRDDALGRAQGPSRVLPGLRRAPRDARLRIRST